MPTEACAGWLRPDWSAPPRVRALMSTRRVRPAAGGGDFDPGRDGRAPAAAANRALLAAALGAQPVWLRQVHGADLVQVDHWLQTQAQAPVPVPVPVPEQGAHGRAAPSETAAMAAAEPAAPVADAAVSASPGVGCVVLVADCLPVLLCDDAGRAVAAAHAGWRGLAAGVLERTVQALAEAAGCQPGALQAWLGPCIGPLAFEVGADVLQAFGVDPDAGSGRLHHALAPHFRRRDRPDGSRRWLADLPALARARLAAAGVQRVRGAQRCTLGEPSDFFSFRRDGSLGRMAAAIALVDG